MSDEARFAIGEFENGGLVSICQFRQAIPAEVRRQFPRQFIVEWQFSDTQSNGLPSKGDYERAVELQGMMTAPLEEDSESLLAIISTGNGYREWYFYCRDPQVLATRFNQVVKGQDFPVELHVGLDPEWKVYEEFTLPFMDPEKRKL